MTETIVLELLDKNLPDSGFVRHTSCYVMPMPVAVTDKMRDVFDSLTEV
jgi:hypothetical protein